MSDNIDRRGQDVLMRKGFNACVRQPIPLLLSWGFSKEEAKALNSGNHEKICYRLVIEGVPFYGAVTAEEAECITYFLHEFVYVPNSPYLDAHGQIEKWGTLSHHYGTLYPMFRRKGFSLNGVFNHIFYHEELYLVLVESIELEEGAPTVYDQIVMRYRNGSGRARQAAASLAIRNDAHYHRARAAATAENAAERRARVQFADDAEEVELALAPLVAAAMAEQVQQALFPEAVVVPEEVAVEVEVPVEVAQAPVEEEEEEEEEPATFQEVAQEMATPSFTPGTPFTMAMSSLGQDFLTQENSLPAFPADEDEEEDEPAQKRVRSEAEEELAPTQVVEEEEEPEEELPPTQPGRQCPNCEEKASVDHWHTCRSKVGYTCSKCSHVVTRLHQLPLVEIPME